MPYPCTDDPDGVFLSTAGDEVDFSRAAVHIVPLSEIPPVFHVKDGGVKECLPGDRLSLIKSSWGTRISKINEPTGELLALVSFKVEMLKEDDVKHIQVKIDAVLGAGTCQFLRWGGKEILLSVKSLDDYKNFGDSFIQGKLDSIEPGILQIKGASFINTPQCFLEILSPANEGKDTQAALNSVVSSFSGAFTQCTILENRDMKPQTESMNKLISGSVPSIAITLMFTAQVQSLAAKTKDALSSLPWRQVSLPGPLQDEIGFDTDYFVNTKIPLPMIGLQMGAASSGVQITRLVQKKENFDEMVKFYQTKLDNSPIGGGASSSAAGILKAKFALSRYSEFVVAFLPGLSCENVTAAKLCMLEKSLEEGRTEISEDGEGNQVLSLSCFK